MTDTVDTLSPEQLQDLKSKAIKVLMTTVKRLPGGTAMLGKVAMELPEGQALLTLVFYMQSRGEL